MNLIIRAVESTDATDLHAIRVQESSIQNTLAIKSMTLARTKAFIDSIDSNTHYMVAEVDCSIEKRRKVVGVCVMSVSSSPKLRHSSTVGINVHEDYQGLGIGRKLMESVIDIADNFLMLKRIELGVIKTNEKAKKLYESLGFVEEGLKKSAVINCGQYVDEYLMARIK